MIGYGGSRPRENRKFAGGDWDISLTAMGVSRVSVDNPRCPSRAGNGLGMHMELDKALIIPDDSKTVAEGVIAAL